ncbi:BRK domain containing protein [Gracilaria domingensis]|nr:BRK domain containing protein [Gracilaria domingensis]
MPRSLPHLAPSYPATLFGALSPDDEHVTVWEPLTGKTVAGNAAPYRRNLGAWLSAHPGWEEKADELKSSKRRSAARRARAAALSFSVLCCYPVAAFLADDAAKRLAALSTKHADDALLCDENAIASWTADDFVRLQEALFTLGQHSLEQGAGVGGRAQAGGHHAVLRAPHAQARHCQEQLAADAVGAALVVAARGRAGAAAAAVVDDVGGGGRRGLAGVVGAGRGVPGAVVPRAARAARDGVEPEQRAHHLGQRGAVPAQPGGVDEAAPGVGAQGGGAAELVAAQPAEEGGRARDAAGVVGAGVGGLSRRAGGAAGAVAERERRGRGADGRGGRGGGVAGAEEAGADVERVELVGGRG